MFKTPLKLVQKFASSIMRGRSILDELGLEGEFRRVEHWRDGKLLNVYKFRNGITNVGKNKLLDVMFNDATVIANASWCIGLVSLTSYSALSASDTIVSHSGWTEFTSYSQSTRVAWGSGAASSQQVTNATAATFDINGSGTVKGIFVNSQNTKSGTTGTLWSTGLFGADVPVVSGDQIKITYGVAA